MSAASCAHPCASYPQTSHQADNANFQLSQYQKYGCRRSQALLLKLSLAGAIVAPPSGRNVKQ